MVNKVRLDNMCSIEVLSNLHNLFNDFSHYLNELKFIESLDNNHLTSHVHFWSVFCWICGAKHINDIDDIIFHGYVESLLSGEENRINNLVIQARSEYGPIKDWDDFSAYIVSKQILTNHSKLTCISEKYPIYKDTFQITCSNEDIYTYLLSYPVHSLKCISSFPSIAFDHMLPNDFDWTRSVMKFYPTKQGFKGNLETYIVPGQYIQDSSLLNVNLHLVNGDLLSYIPNTIPVSNVRYINSDVKKHERVLSWMNYRDMTPLLQSISIQATRDIRASSHFKINDHNSKIKGGVMIFENCHTRALCTLAMCEKTRLTEIKKHKWKTLLITSSPLVSFWEDKIFELCKPQNKMRLVTIIHKRSRPEHIINSRYVILHKNQLINLFHLVSSEPWFRIVIDGYYSPTSLTYSKIKELQSIRKWYLSVEYNMACFDMIGLWDIVQRPRIGNSKEGKYASQALALRVSSHNLKQRWKVHLCKLDEKTHSKLATFYDRICETKKFKPSFVRPMLNILASGRDINEAMLWNIFISENMLPGYSSLPNSTVEGISSPHCVVCHDQPLYQPVQLSCCHIICYSCTKLLNKCPLCRTFITGYSIPTSSNRVPSLGMLKCNNKYDQINTFIESLPDNSKIVYVSPSIGIHVPGAMELDIQQIDYSFREFEMGNFKILLIPRKYLHMMHYHSITDMIIPFAKDNNLPICTCSPNVTIHFFVFESTIEEFMLYSTLDWKTQKFWVEFKKSIC